MENNRLDVAGSISKRYLVMVTHEGHSHRDTVYMTMRGDGIVGSVPSTAFDIDAARQIIKFLQESFPELANEVPPEVDDYEQLIAAYK